MRIVALAWECGRCVGNCGGVPILEGMKDEMVLAAPYVCGFRMMRNSKVSCVLCRF